MCRLRWQPSPPCAAQDGGRGRTRGLLYPTAHAPAWLFHMTRSLSHVSRLRVFELNGRLHRRMSTWSKASFSLPSAHPAAQSTISPSYCLLASATGMHGHGSPEPRTWSNHTDSTCATMPTCSRAAAFRSATGIVDAQLFTSNQAATTRKSLAQYAPALAVQSQKT